MRIATALCALLASACASGPGMTQDVRDLDARDLGILVEEVRRAQGELEVAPVAGVMSLSDFEAVCDRAAGARPERACALKEHMVAVEGALDAAAGGRIQLRDVDRVLAPEGLGDDTLLVLRPEDGASYLEVFSMAAQDAAPTRELATPLYYGALQVLTDGETRLAVPAREEVTDLTMALPHIYREEAGRWAAGYRPEDAAYLETELEARAALVAAAEQAVSRAVAARRQAVTIELPDVRVELPIDSAEELLAHWREQLRDGEAVVEDLPARRK